MADLKQVKTEALAAAVPHIEPYQKAVNELHDFEMKTDTKYHAGVVASEIERMTYLAEKGRESGDAKEEKTWRDQLKDFKERTPKPGELDTRNSWTEEEIETWDRLNETVQGTSKKLKESMTPVMKKHGLSLESNKPSLEEMMNNKGQEREPNGRDIIGQISGDLARQAIAFTKTEPAETVLSEDQTKFAREFREVEGNQKLIDGFVDQKTAYNKFAKDHGIAYFVDTGKDSKFVSLPDFALATLSADDKKKYDELEKGYNKSRSDLHKGLQEHGELKKDAAFIDPVFQKIEQAADDKIKAKEKLEELKPLIGKASTTFPVIDTTMVAVSGVPGGVGGRHLG